MSSENVAELIVRLIDDVSAPARAMGASLKGLTEDVGKINTTFFNMGKAAKKSFGEAKEALLETAIAAGAFYVAIKKPIELAMEFNGVLKTLQIQTGRTEEQMRTLGDRFGDLAGKLHISAQVIAASTKDLPASIRGSSDAMIQTLEVAGKFARAWDADYGATIKTVTPLTKIFGLSVQQLTPAFSALTRSAKDASMPIETLMENLPKFAEEAKSLHVTGIAGFKNQLAWITSMTKATGDLGLSMNSYQKIMEQAYKRGFGKGTPFSMTLVQREAAQTGRDIGIVLYEHLNQIIKSKGPAFEKEMEGRLGLTGRLMGTAWQVFKNAAGDVIEEQKRLNDSSGELNDAFVERMGEWGESWKGLAVQVETFGRTIGQTLGPGLAPYVDMLKDAVHWTTEWARMNGSLISGGTALAGMLIGLSGALAAVRLIFWGLVLLFSPVNIGIAMIAAAVTLAVVAWQNWDKIIEKVRSGLEWFKSLPGGIADWFKSGGFLNDQGKKQFGYSPSSATGAAGGFHPISGAAWPELTAASAAERAARGQDTVVRPLQSIDRKMSDLLDALRGASGPAGYPGLAYGGATPSSGGGGVTPHSGGGGGTPDTWRGGQHGGGTTGRGEGVSGGHGTGTGEVPQGTPPAAPGTAGQYRPVYQLRAADLSDAVVNTIAGEAVVSNQKSVDAVVNNMLNRVGQKGWGPSGNMQEVARAKGQYAGYRRASEKQAEYIRSRIRAIASGSEPDITHGADEYRAGSYRGPWYQHHQDAPVIGGNRFAKNPKVAPGPYAPYAHPHEGAPVAGGHAPTPGQSGGAVTPSHPGGATPEHQSRLEMKTKYPQAWSALQGEGSSASKVGALVKHYEYPRDTGGAISQRLRFLGGKFKSGGETASPEHPLGAERDHVSEMQQGASAISAKPYIDDEHIDDFIRKTEIARNKMRQLETQGTGGGSQHHHRIRTSLNNRWGSANEVQGG